MIFYDHLWSFVGGNLMINGIFLLKVPYFQTSRTSRPVGTITSGSDDDVHLPTRNHPGSPTGPREMGLSENSVPLHPMVNDQYPY